MKVSVALCTYNGSKYILEQLESIKNQTLLPDEIIVCDDRSEDNTLDIIRKFSSEVSIPVKIFVNSLRLGVTKNFKKAIGLCHHDFIALCDQDDVWLSNNLEEKINFLLAQRNEHLNVVFSDLQLVNNNKEYLPQTMWQHIRFTNAEINEWKEGKALNILLKRGNVVTGASVVFRSSFANKFLHYLEQEFKNLLHDGIIAIVAAKENSIQLIEKATILYRQHEAQQLGTGEAYTKPSLKKRLSEIGKGTFDTDPYLSLLEDRITDLKEFEIGENQLPGINKILKHIRCRRKILRSSKIKRVYLVGKEFLQLRYKRYSNSVVLDPVRDFIHKKIVAR